MTDYATESGQIGEHHTMWLLWFVMRHGAEVPSNEEQAWSYEHVGVQVRLAVQDLGDDLRVVKAAGRRWNLRLMMSRDGLSLKNLSNPKCFWRDLGVMRLCDSDNLPFSCMSRTYCSRRSTDEAIHHAI